MSSFTGASSTHFNVEDGNPLWNYVTRLEILAILSKMVHTQG